MKKISVLFIALLIAGSAGAQKKFDNEFYFRFGYSNPCWKQFGGDKDWWPEGTTRWGLTGEIGTIFMLTTLNKNETLVLGLDVDYASFYWHRFSYQEGFFNYDLGTLRIDSKIGPSLTISPNRRIAFDFFVKADLSWFTGTAVVVNDDTDDAEGYGNIFAVGISTGANFRFSILMIGFEFNRITPILRNFDDNDLILGNAQNDGDRTPFPSMNFTVGLSF